MHDRSSRSGPRQVPARSSVSIWRPTRCLAAACLPCLTTLSLTLATGCEEAEGRQQVAAQQVIEQVAGDYRRMDLGSPALAEGDEVARQRQALGQLASKLTSISGAAPGQRAAANLLASQISTSMAELAADRLRDLEADLRRQRTELAPRIDAAVRLGILASALESFDPSQDRASLARLRSEAVEVIEASRRRVGELERPVAELLADNDATLASLIELERQEADLRTRARGAGPVRGFPLVEQASQKRTQADALRVRIARNEVQLGELRPEQTLAVADAEQGQMIVETLDGAKADLASLKAGADDMAQGARARIEVIRGEVAAAIEAIDATLGGPVAELHEQAAADLAKAAQLARQAASPDAGRDVQSAARIDLGASQQALAQVHWGYALALGDQMAFLERIAATPGLAADPDALRRAAAALGKARDEATEQAKAAAGEAIETIGLWAGDSAEGTALKETLTSLIAAMEGKAIKLGGGALAGAPTEEVPGFESPEALLEFLQRNAAAPPDPATVRSMAYAFRGSSAPGRAVQSFMAINFEDGAEFISAVARKFGADALNSDGGMDPLGNVASFKVGETRDNRATLEPTEPGEKPLPLIRSGGRWYIDVDGLITNRPQEMADTVAAAQMFQQAGPVMDQLRAGIRSAARDVAGRVRNDEFSSALEAQQAFQAAVQAQAMEMVSKMMGGLQDTLQGAGLGNIQDLEKMAQEAMKNLSPEDRKRMEDAIKSGQMPQLPGR